MTRERFIVVEQSALAVGGHYSQYTTAIARAAREAGLEPLVLSNRRAEPDARSRTISRSGRPSR
ncbi:hypothetical protein R1A27_28955 [Methylobacterium sp. NMS12]|uniref:hypothetical protein n=1 Tax=Methylobacterium sp. NMS12 TaxID=3079766 RepID=UPI003F880EC6